MHGIQRCMKLIFISFQVFGSHKRSTLVGTPFKCLEVTKGLVQACCALAFSFSLFKGDRLLATNIL